MKYIVDDDFLDLVQKLIDKVRTQDLTAYHLTDLHVDVVNRSTVDEMLQAADDTEWVMECGFDEPENSNEKS